MATDAGRCEGGAAASSWVPNPLRITPLAAAKRSTITSAALQPHNGAYEQCVQQLKSAPDLSSC